MSRLNLQRFEKNLVVRPLALSDSDIPFKRDAIAAECTPNIEMVIFEDLDLELLKKHRQSGSVLNWKDRRPDLYEVRYHGVLQPTTAADGPTPSKPVQTLAESGSGIVKVNS
jgi:hypothetical protein